MSFLTGKFPSGVPVVKAKLKHVAQPKISRSSLPFMPDIDEEEEDLIYTTSDEPSHLKMHLQLTYFEILRAVTNLVSGSPNSTVAQLMLLNDMELHTETVQDALRQNKGVDVIINILEVEDPKCVAGSLRVLAKLASNDKIRMYITHLGAIENTVKLLQKPMMDVKIYAVRALSAICQINPSARFLRKEGGIRLLVDFMHLEEDILFTATDLLTADQRDDVKLATVTATALTHVAKYPKNSEEIHRSGIILALKNVLYTCHNDLLTEAFQLLEVLTSRVEKIRVAVETEGFIAPLLAGLSTGCTAARAACAAVLSSICDKSVLARHIVRLLQGLPLIVNILREMSKETKNDERLLMGITSAVAKLAQDMRNVKKMTEKGVVQALLKLLDQCFLDIPVFSNILEGLAECAKLKDNRPVIGRAQTIAMIVNKLHESDKRLLTTVAQCLGSCANDPMVAQTISDYDGMRMLFSVLQVDDPGVQATAFWALRPIVMYAKDSAEDIRSFTGSLGLIVSLMDSKNPYVLAQAASFVSEVAKDMENLTILSDRGLVNALSKRVDVRDTMVMTHLAEAIAEASTLPWNAHEFGMMGVVVAMRNYLDTHVLDVHLQAMKALAMLTKNPFNSVVLHQCDGLRAVLLDIAGPSEELQDYAMQVVNNLRMVALSAENKFLGKEDLLAYASLLRGMKIETPVFNAARPAPSSQQADKGNKKKKEKNTGKKNIKKMPRDTQPKKERHENCKFKI